MNESEGRVEIFYNNTWGTVCDNTWDLNDARVVCHYLGFSGALGAPRGAAFPSADLFAPIWLDQVYCTGFEEGLDECPHGEYGDHLCTGGHNEDAGVICRGMRSTCVCESICTASRVLCGNMYAPATCAGQAGAFAPGATNPTATDRSPSHVLERSDTV